MFNSPPAPPERRKMKGKQTKREGDNEKGIERNEGLLTSEVVSLRVGSVP